MVDLLADCRWKAPETSDARILGDRATVRIAVKAALCRMEAQRADRQTDRNATGPSPKLSRSSLQFHVLVIDRRQIRQPRLQQLFWHIVRTHVG